MSILKDYMEVCNYNPLAVISPITGVFATQVIDGILDHKSFEDVIKIGGIALMPPGILLVLTEIGLDYVFRRDVGKRKLQNLKDLIKKHNGCEPCRNYDLFYSIEAEASKRCKYGADIIHLYSINWTVKDDFSDRKTDGPSNLFNMHRNEAYAIFEKLKVPQMVARLENVPVEELTQSAPYRCFGLKDPRVTYENLRNSPC